MYSQSLLEIVELTPTSNVMFLIRRVMEPQLGCYFQADKVSATFQ